MAAARRPAGGLCCAVLCAAMLSVWRRAELGFLIVLTWSCTGLVRGRLTGSDFLKAYGETDPDYDRSDEPPDPPGYGARASRWPGVGERLDAGGDASTLMRVDSVRETARPGQPVPAPAHGTEPGRILEAGRRPSPSPGSVLMDQPLGSRDPDWMSGSRQPAPDSHWEPSPGGAQGEVSGPPLGSWLRRGPRVHCGADGMTLTVRGRRADDIAVAPGGATPIPLSQLPPHCGLSWRKTWRELVLTVPYTGCATSQQGGRYVLPVLWQGRPVLMSCPVFPLLPPPISCSPAEMSVQLEALSVQELRVHLRGQWVLVDEVAVHCGFSWRRSEDRLVFTVAYSGCGVKSEGGVYSLTLLWGEREVTLSCPAVLPPAPPPPGTAAPPPRPPSLLCRKTRMWAVLPSARPDSLQVRDRSGAWRPVGGAAPLCAYEVKRGDEGGVVFSSPLPGCDSRTLAPSLLSLPLRFHDDALLRWRTLDLRCPVAPGQTPPTPPRTTDHPGPRPSPHPLHAPLQPRVTCGQQHLSVDLPRGPVRGIAVRSASGEEVGVLGAAGLCGYEVTSAGDRNTLRVPYSACHVRREAGRYTLEVLYVAASGARGASRLSCPLRPAPASPGCSSPPGQRVQCGAGGLSPSGCLRRGCCVEPLSGRCYYPMDECTPDGHFVFSVARSLAEPPLDPTSLVIAGNPSCSPLVSTPDFAVFRVPLSGCGTRSFVVGETLVYLTEVTNTMTTRSQNYGRITRDLPFRLFVECRYAQGSLTSVGLLVKMPFLPPILHAEGKFGVQLLIATDEHYTQFYPQYHRPLSLLLGRPLFLEVRLVSPPDPSLVLLVHYCLAYPRSAQAAWVLIYDGCPNPLDVGQTSVLHPGPADPTRQRRRFLVRAFQFVPSHALRPGEDQEVRTARPAAGSALGRPLTHRTRPSGPGGAGACGPALGPPRAPVGSWSLWLRLSSATVGTPLLLVFGVSPNPPSLPRSTSCAPRRSAPPARGPVWRAASRGTRSLGPLRLVQEEAVAQCPALQHLVPMGQSSVQAVQQDPSSSDLGRDAKNLYNMIV
ncbi:uncharacterized protein [Lepisosteus oculatus]|uniref:uncharacterized protein isoform X2 n=1 Tax=Lepisosteus oculatus TaxID=7918 RepID=UPI0035F5208B